MIFVPEDFATDTITREGIAGRKWIEELPGRVKTLCDQWDLVVDGPVMHGYLGLVIPVSRGNEACVLKVSWPGEFTRHEAAALLAWDGRGAAKLLDVEPLHAAMLLERLDNSRSLNDVEIEEALHIAGSLLRRLAIHAPNGLPLLRTWATGRILDLPERWERYGRPMPRRVLEQAHGLANELGGASTGDLLVNYDLHYADVLASKREPWLVVDPMVVVGDPEFGIAQLLWRRLEDIQAQGGLDHHFQVLTEAAELDLALARAWTLVRCVDYWLWGLSVGLTYDPARCEVIVNWLA